MTTAAKQTFANKVFMAAAPTAPTTMIAELLDFNPPRASRDTEDATTHDSVGGAQEFIADGIYDPGELTIEMNYIARSTGDQAFWTAMTGGALQNFKLQFKTATGFEDWTGSGYVTAYGPGAQPVKGKQTASATFKVSGAITRVATA